MAKTRQLVMRKKADSSAKDKAMAIAEMLGKPTSTGVATGLGLATILAAAGALNKKDGGEGSVLSNPLVLAALGAGGGYLAGNALENAPVRTEDHEISLPALGFLLSGLGVAGRHAAISQAEKQLPGLAQQWAAHTRGLTPRIFYGENGRGPAVKRWDEAVAQLGDPQFEKDFKATQKEYGTALRRAGQKAHAIEIGAYAPPESRLGRIMDSIKESPNSPVSWLRSANPLKGRSWSKFLHAINPLRDRASRGILGSLKNFGARTVRHFVPKSGAGMLALALLAAGGGKAIYDYTKD